MSFGFLVVTRMLQRYPELTKKVDMLISLVGFSHKDDFAFSRRRYNFYVWGARFFRLRLPAAFFKYVCLQPAILRRVYSRSFNAREKFKDLQAEEFTSTMDVEIGLWQCNDVRTHMATNFELLTVDNCNKQIDLPLWHVSVKQDRYFNPHVVEQHLRVVFSDVHHVKAKLDNHAPSIIADEKMAAPLVPARLRRILASQ
jgi:pimeloyl-ACP methyl ester carboxylesterase